MNNIIKRFFNIDKILKLINKKWNNVLKNIIPSSKKTLVKDSEFTDVGDGTILMAVGSIISTIFGALLSASVIVQTGLLKSLYGQTTFAQAMSMQSFSLIIGLIGSIIIPALIYSYNRYAKENEQNSIIYFIICIFSFIGLLDIIINFIKYFIYIFTSPLFAILSIASLFISFMGYVYMLNGSIDFCVRCNKKTSK